MKIYKVELDIDTGYEHFNRVCILHAENEKEAKVIADRYTNSRISGQSIANVKNVMEFAEDDGILYYGRV